MPAPSAPAPPAGPIGPSLVAAYRATDYVVDAPDGPVVLRVGAPNEAMATLLGRLRAGTAALLTAHNPGSVATAAADNDAAQRALEAALAAHGVPMLAAVARDPSGAWPDEPSVLAIGLSPAAADALARRFGQNAWLRVDAPAAVPALAFTRDVRDDADRGAAPGPATEPGRPPR